MPSDRDLNAKVQPFTVDGHWQARAQIRIKSMQNNLLPQQKKTPMNHSISLLILYWSIPAALSFSSLFLERRMLKLILSPLLPRNASIISAIYRRLLRNALSVDECAHPAHTFLLFLFFFSPTSFAVRCGNGRKSPLICFQLILAGESVDSSACRSNIET